MTRVWVEQRLCYQDHRKNDVFTLSATMPTELKLNYLAGAKEKSASSQVPSGKHTLVVIDQS